MPFNPETHHRRSIRLKDYDYSQPGSYFVTICTHNHINLFGRIISNRAGLEPARTENRTKNRTFDPISHIPSIGTTTKSIGSMEQSKNQISSDQIELGTFEEYSMDLNNYGKIVHQAWNNLVNHITGIKLGEFVIMPNHFHGIIHILDPENDWEDFIPSDFIYKNSQTNTNLSDSVQDDSVQSDSSRAGSVRAGSKPAPHHHQKQAPVSEIIRQFKTFSSRKINRIRNSPSLPVWKRDYYEHIIRDQESYDHIVDYVNNNPMMWKLDKFFKE